MSRRADPTDRAPTRDERELENQAKEEEEEDSKPRARSGYEVSDYKIADYETQDYKIPEYMSRHTTDPAPGHA